MNILVGQSGGPTAVINASVAGVYQAAVQAGATVYGMRNGLAGLLEERIFSLNEVLDSDFKVELLKRTPAAFLGSCRYKLKKAEVDATDYEKVFAILKKCVAPKATAQSFIAEATAFATDKFKLLPSWMVRCKV